MWLRQAQDGPTLVSRVIAVRALGASNESAASEFLRRTASDESQKKWLRVEAVKALAKRGNAADVRGLVSSARDTWEVRLAVTEGLVTLANSEKLKDDASLRSFVSRTLAARAASDDSLRVRCAAVRGIGTLKLSEHEGLVREAIQVSSQSDDMRQAGLAALAAIRTGDAMDVMIAFTQEGSDNRTRGAAIELIGKLADKDAEPAAREKGIKALAALLSTRSARPRFAAADALADTGDPSVIAHLQAAEQAAHAPELAARFRQQRERVEKKLAEGK